MASRYRKEIRDKGRFVNRIAIVKTGSTLSHLASSRGDFEDWILSGMGVHSNRAVVLDVANGSRLSRPDRFSGIIVTGSHAQVTDHQPWSEKTAEWLVRAVERQIPTLGICYGHQLLAYAMGGEVGDNPNGLEFGTVELQMMPEAQADALFGGLPPSTKVQVSHLQSVLRLPPGARRLASSAMETNQAFVVGPTAWGVQFHPEFDTEVVIAYIHHFREALQRQDKDPDQLIKTSQNTPDSHNLLRRFAEMAI
jgi:GMP synthase (glutamine-hydrolysing)